MTCASCGRPYDVGEWPWCPHGVPSVAVIDDALEGGARWCDTMGHEPVWLDGTKSQWRREVDKRTLVNIVKHDANYYARQRKQHDEKLRDERV